MDRFEIIIDKWDDVPPSIDYEPERAKRMIPGHTGTLLDEAKVFIPKTHFFNFRINGVILTDIFNLEFGNSLTYQAQTLPDIGASFYFGHGSLALEELKIIRYQGQLIDQINCYQIYLKLNNRADEANTILCEKDSLNERDPVLITCSACGDYWCDARGFEIEVYENEIIWNLSDWYQNEKPKFGKLRYRFDKQQYQAEFDRYRAYLHDLVYKPKQKVGLDFLKKWEYQKSEDYNSSLDKLEKAFKPFIHHSQRVILEEQQYLSAIEDQLKLLINTIFTTSKVSYAIAESEVHQVKLEKIDFHSTDHLRVWGVLAFGSLPITHLAYKFQNPFLAEFHLESDKLVMDRILFGDYDFMNLDSEDWVGTEVSWMYEL